MGGRRRAEESFDLQVGIAIVYREMVNSGVLYFRQTVFYSIIINFFKYSMERDFSCTQLFIRLPAAGNGGAWPLHQHIVRWRCCVQLLWFLILQCSGRCAISEAGEGQRKVTGEVRRVVVLWRSPGLSGVRCVNKLPSPSVKQPQLIDG